MKKLIVILALVAVACAPAMAAVTVSCAQVGTTKDCDVSYNVTDSTVSGRSLSTFQSTAALKSPRLAVLELAGYYIYPGSIQISGGSVTSYGSCVCDATAYPRRYSARYWHKCCDCRDGFAVHRH